MAEKEARKKAKKSKKKKSKLPIALAVIAILLILAVGIFIGTANRSSEGDRFTRGAETFAKALVMNNVADLRGCVHPDAYGQMELPEYRDVEHCDTKIVECEQWQTERWGQTFREEYGVAEPVTALYRVRVGCTVYGESTYACTMDVIVGEVDGVVYALEAENISAFG